MRHGGRPARRPRAPVNPFPFDASQRGIDPHSTRCAAGRGDGSNESVRGQIRRMLTFRRQRYRVQPHWIPDISDIVSDPNEAGSNVTLDYGISEIGSNEAGSDIVESDTTSTTITGSNEAGSDIDDIGSDEVRIQYRSGPKRDRIRCLPISDPTPSDPILANHWTQAGSDKSTTLDPRRVQIRRSSSSKTFASDRRRKENGGGTLLCVWGSPLAWAGQCVGPRRTPPRRPGRTSRVQELDQAGGVCGARLTSRNRMR